MVMMMVMMVVVAHLRMIKDKVREEDKIEVARIWTGGVGSGKCDVSV